MRHFCWKNAMGIGLCFGGFQALMPFCGWLLGTVFAKNMMQCSHWIAFVLLAFIGGKMLLEAWHSRKELSTELEQEPVTLYTLLLLAIATSIDAFAVGVTFSVMPDTNIPCSILLIGVITFCISVAGVKIGNVFGDRFRPYSGILGGCILLAIGGKILLEGLGLL